MARLDTPQKQWKFSDADLEERKFWPVYMKAHANTISQTSTEECPWIIIPSDDRHNAQLIIAQIVVNALEGLPTQFPLRPAAEVARMKAALEKQ